MCDLDLETCELWKQSQVKSRKSHRCDCCRGSILPGQMYTRHFSVYDGVPCSEKQCQWCSEMAKSFMASHGTQGVPSYMAELLAECINEEPDEAGEWVEALADMGKREKDDNRFR